MTSAELFVARREQAGNDTFHGLPGDENTALMLAIEASGIRFVLTRHEQSAAFMASVHGRLTERPAGCLAALGPGAAHLVTGLADATLDFGPMVAITGQLGTARLALSESHQVVDLTTLFAPVTKLSRTLSDAAENPGTVAEALRVAKAPRPGAVHLSRSEDVASQAVHAHPLPVPAAPVLEASRTDIAHAAKVLLQADRPIVVAGAGVMRAGAADAVAAYAQAHDLPLVTTFMGNGILPAAHPLALGTLGQPFEDHADRARKRADLIVAVGFDAVETPPSGWSDGAAAHILHIAETPAPADLGWQVMADVVGALIPSMRGLSQAVGDRRWGLFGAAKAARRAVRDARARPAPPKATERLLPTDTVLSGVGTRKRKVARALAAKRPGERVLAKGLAGMGVALPGASAAADLCAKGRVQAIVGDGAFLMNVQDMEHAARQRSPITVLPWEAGCYGLIAEKQQSDTGRHKDLGFGNPGWGNLCRAFGWRHVAVDTFADLAPALASSGEDDGPVLVSPKVGYGHGLAPPKAVA